MGTQQKTEKLHQTGRCCIYCGHPLTVEQTTIDHIIPLSRGGVNEDENKIACCESCNQKKGDLYPGAFASTMSLRQRRGFENRVTALCQQKRITPEKRDLLLDKPNRLTKALNYTLKIFKRSVKIAVFIRKA